MARSAGVLALATTASRVLGFIGAMLMAGLFGTTAQSQAFVVAFRLPNLLRDLVAEGAVTSAFVPVLSWYRAKASPEEFWKLTQALWTRASILLCGLGLLGSLAAPWLVRLIAPGFLADPEKFALTVRLTRILFPFITLVGLWAFFMGLLNSLRHFAVPALGSAVLNLATIAACVWWVPLTTPGILAVAMGVMIGGAMQLAMQVPVAMSRGFRFGWRWSHPGARDIVRLLGPRVIGSAVYQASVLMDTILASLGAIVGEGAVAALFFANRLVQLPLAVFGTASAQASLPTLSEHAAHRDMAAFRGTLIHVTRMVGFVILPSAVGLMVLAFPIVGGLFERGAFDHRATVMTAQALICYSIGLLAYAVSKVITGAFYAMHDTWTSVRLALEALSLNLVLCLLLMWPMKIAGLALAAALANSLNAFRLMRRLEQRLGQPLLAPVLAAFGRMLLASIGMGACCALLWYTLDGHLHALMRLLLVIGCGPPAYLLGCWLLRVEEWSRVTQWLRQFPLWRYFAPE